MKIVLLTAALLLATLPCFCWGFYGHRKINYYACFLLPPDMLVFYKKHIDYITEHAVDPDKRRYSDPEEAPRHTRPRSALSIIYRYDAHDHR